MKLFAQQPVSKGFTLIELMVSVTLFIVIMLVSVGALLSLVNANRKARALESVINNLNITLDGIVRAARMGSAYACNASALPPDYATSGSNCSGGGTTFSFAPFGTSASDNATRDVFRLSGSRLERSVDGGASWTPVTAPEVVISDLAFYVVGTTVGDTTQPKVVMVVKGTAGATENTQTTFYIQATAVQRTLDI